MIQAGTTDPRRACPPIAAWRRLVWLVGIVLLGALLALPSGSAGAVSPGASFTGQLALGGKIIPLPAGEWIVAGTGIQDFDMVEIGAFGVIHNVVLAQYRAGRVVALLEVNTNAVPVNDGWGRAAACRKGSPALLVVTRYRTGWETSCIVVRTTETQGAAEGPPAWRDARSRLAEAGRTMPSIWASVGFRLSDRQDIVDLRFHFAPALFIGDAAGTPATADGWTPEALRANPVRLGVIETLSVWAVAFDAWIERGLRNQLPASHAPPAMPLVLAFDSLSPHADAKLAAVEELYRSGALNRADYLRQSRLATTEVPLIVEETRSVPLSVQKNISFRVFGSIVDYGLAYFITANSQISGAITATIVVIHSIIFVLNDNYWEDYWATHNTRNANRMVDFRYIGDPA